MATAQTVCIPVVVLGLRSGNSLACVKMAEKLPVVFSEVPQSLFEKVLEIVIMHRYLYSY